MSSRINKKEKNKNILLHKIKFDTSLGHLYPENEDFIKQRLDDFASTNSVHEPEAVHNLNQTLRHDIYATVTAPKVPKHYTTKIVPGRVPDDASTFAPRELNERPQEIVEFMIRKQNESSARFRQERKDAQEKSNSRKRENYVQPRSLYKPPIQKYRPDRPYIQEYVRYRYDLKPVVMPTFTHKKGSIRDRARAQYMPVKDPNKVSKRDQYFNERTEKLQKEMVECVEIKKNIRSKKKKEAERLSELEQHMSMIASPIKSSRPATSICSHRETMSLNRPGTCNSFSPAASKFAFDRPNYPTAGRIWLTDV